jgi:hypothetical protein
MSLVTWARDVAQRHLDIEEFRDRRWKHVQAVGAKGEAITPAFGSDGELLAAAAWLHDLGYAPSLAKTGFHHLDGARAVRDLGMDSQLPGLVANHSGGALEAPMRGLACELAEFPDAGGPVRDALWACDMTTSPTGDPIEFEDRLRDIVARYGPDHCVPRSITAAADEIRAAIRRSRRRVRAAGLDVDF